MLTRPGLSASSSLTAVTVPETGVYTSLRAGGSVRADAPGPRARAGGPPQRHGGTQSVRSGPGARERRSAPEAYTRQGEKKDPSWERALESRWLW